MIGHGQKNTNRGEAINRNAARIAKLAKKIAEIKKEMAKDLEVLGEEILDTDVRTSHRVQKALSAVVTHEIRLRYLERPWWKKLFRIKPEISITLQKASEVDAPKLDEPEETGKVVQMPKKGHHVLDIKNSKLGTKSPIIGEKEEKKKKPAPPPTPSHRQVVVDPKKPGPTRGD